MFFPIIFLTIDRAIICFLTSTTFIFWKTLTTKTLHFLIQYKTTSFFPGSVCIYTRFSTGNSRKTYHRNTLVFFIFLLILYKIFNCQVTRVCFFIDCRLIGVGRTAAYCGKNKWHFGLQKNC